MGGIFVSHFITFLMPKNRSRKSKKKSFFGFPLKSLNFLRFFLIFPLLNSVYGSQNSPANWMTYPTRHSFSFGEKLVNHTDWITFWENIFVLQIPKIRPNLAIISKNMALGKWNSPFTRMNGFTLMNNGRPTRSLGLVWPIFVCANFCNFLFEN